MANIFIIGSKGIPAKYGGFETFVEQLTAGQRDKKIQYHVACLGKENREFEHNGARCFEVKVPNVGSAKAVLYDLFALQQCIAYIKEHRPQNCVIYVLACRMGPFLLYYAPILRRMNVKLYINPDGHEWMRGKWNRAIRTYWKVSERMSISKADLVICDSKGIESYIHREYKSYNPKTRYISYGASMRRSSLSLLDENLTNWYQRFNVRPNDYYLIVGRFVPENNYELIIREFMRSDSTRDLVIISNVEQNKFFEQLQAATGFQSDPRIKFVGTVYNQELLMKLREQAYGYFHGHEVGGTNPSLLEALASTRINLLLDVVFNREVGENGAFYFTKEEGSLSDLINETDQLSEEQVAFLSRKARNRIESYYSWDFIVSEYELQFASSDAITLQENKGDQTMYRVKEGVVSNELN
ncbi:MAG: beta 1-4 rhamnosyltransferase Cps2T [Bacillota bacterium]